MTTREVLVKARKLIETPERWTQGAFARDANGKKVSMDAPGGCAFCLEGAIYRAEDALRPSAGFGHWHAIDDALQGLGANTEDTIAWNDAPERTHAEVLAVFDKAIAECDR